MKSLLLEKCSVQKCEKTGTERNYMRVFLFLCAKKEKKKEKTHQTFTLCLGLRNKNQTERILCLLGVCFSSCRLTRSVMKMGKVSSFGYAQKKIK